MRRALLLGLALLAGIPAAASGQEMSANVARVATIPELKSAISLNFIGDTMFVSTAAGIFAYDVSDPAAPARLGALPMYIWENEDVDLDRRRKRLFISRDPRGFTTPGAAFPYGGVHVIDVANPHAMTQIGYVFANSFYEQGVRFLDLTDPADIRQIGWYRPGDANVWAPCWHKGHVFVADFTRGVDVLKFSGSAASRTVRAPARRVQRRTEFSRS